MNTLWKRIITKTTLRRKNQGEPSKYQLAKGHKVLINSLKQHIKDFVLIVAGIFSASFGFKGFLLTNHFIDGGATGISLLISVLTDIPLYFFKSLKVRDCGLGLLYNTLISRMAAHALGLVYPNNITMSTASMASRINIFILFFRISIIINL